MANPNVPSATLSPDFLLPFLMQQLAESQRQQGISDLNANYATNRARDEASGLQSQLSSLMSAPEPQVNQWAQLAANIGGGLSQIAAPQLGGQERAQQLVQGEQQTLNQRRQARLKMLEGAYERAAERAAKLGDDQQHIKMLSAAERVSNNLKALNDAAITASSDKTRKQISQGENAARIKAAEIEAGARRDVAGSDLMQAQIRAGWRYDAASQSMVPPDPGTVTPIKDWLLATTKSQHDAVTAKGTDNQDAALQALRQQLATMSSTDVANPRTFVSRLRLAKAPYKTGGLPVLKWGEKQGELFAPSEVLQLIMVNFKNPDGTPISIDRAGALMRLSQYSPNVVDAAVGAMKAASAVPGR